jgi:GNAT superfamily N-acetyltransferase
LKNESQLWQSSLTVSAPPHRWQGPGTWLLGEAARWLELAEVTRLLGYAAEDEQEYATFLTTSGFQLLTRVTRGLRQA